MALRVPAFFAGQRSPQRIEPTFDEPLGLRRRIDRPPIEWADPLSIFSPELSARTGLVTWQKVALAGLISTIVSLAVVVPGSLRLILLLLVTLPFAGILIIRIFAIGEVLRRDQNAIAAAADRTSRNLPSFSILVPLFKEADVVDQLVDAMRALDYPPTKKQIIFIVEEKDTLTRQGFARKPLDANMSIVVVPPGAPQTKPRALNYALGMAGGDVITVYDAEDVPEPDQLLKVAAVLSHGNERIGCVQAGLNIYNSRDGWLTRQFTIEYSALFGGFLPALVKLGLPVPLGGTSNHFPRHIIERIGGWDPYNVTEDADLGVRLARLGYAVRVVRATTWEEAPVTLRAWTGQRARWLKGWVQTYVVHMRRPFRLLHDLGLRGFLGFQVLMGGFMLSGLVHPWFYALLAYDVVTGQAFEPGKTWMTQMALALGWFNLVAGYVSAVGLGAVAVLRRGWWSLALHALLMPLYWLLVSWAAYRAIYDYIRRPHYWEKTQHHGRRSPAMN